MKHLTTAALAVVLGIGAMGAALGQGIVTDPAVIRACLCAEQKLAAIKGRADLTEEVFDQDQAALGALDAQIEQARASVNTAIQGQVASLKEMNLQREQLYARTYDVDLPAAQAATEAYNNAAGRYSDHCVGRSFDSIQMQQMRANLSCPQRPAP